MSKKKNKDFNANEKMPDPIENISQEPNEVLTPEQINEDPQVTTTTPEISDDTLIKDESSTPISEEEIQQATYFSEVTLIDGVVVGGKLNVRKDPSKDSEILKVLNDGDKVVVTKANEQTDDSDYYEVHLGEDTVGYCIKTFIKID